MMRTILFVLALSVTVINVANAYQDDHIRVSFISETTTLQPGKRAWVGVLFEPQDHWHVYWQNPGDSGLAPKVTLSLPDGLTAGKIHWPAPEAIPVAHLMNYGYHRVLLMLPVEVDKNVQADQSLSLTAKVNWLVCKEECIPGRTQLQITLPVSDESLIATSKAKEFQTARQQLPATLPPGRASFRIVNDRVLLDIELTDATGMNSQNLSLYPVTADLVNYSELPQIVLKGNRVNASFSLSEYFSTAPDQFDFVLTADSETAFQGSATAKE